MSNAYVIETPRHTAGIAVREPLGFRFYASDAQYAALDNRSFSGLRALRAAIEMLAAGRRETNLSTGDSL
jgi:hypothetical protein